MPACSTSQQLAGVVDRYSAQGKPNKLSTLYTPHTPHSIHSALYSLLPTQKLRWAGYNQYKLYEPYKIFEPLNF